MFLGHSVGTKWTSASLYSMFVAVVVIRLMCVITFLICHGIVQFNNDIFYLARNNTVSVSCKIMHVTDYQRVLYSCVYRIWVPVCQMSGHFPHPVSAKLLTAMLLDTSAG